METPVVYTIRGCDACVKLLKKWDADGVRYEERRVELSQAVLDEARKFGDMVPIVVWWAALFNSIHGSVPGLLRDVFLVVRGSQEPLNFSGRG
jgi:hypothetical protein